MVRVLPLMSALQKISISTSPLSLMPLIRIMHDSQILPYAIVPLLLQL